MPASARPGMTLLNGAAVDGAIHVGGPGKPANKYA
jgi:hypothetical protein